VDYDALSGGQALVRLGLYGAKWGQSSTPSPGAENAVFEPGLPPASGNKRLLINEFMADNEKTLPDPDDADEFEDWLEIYNPSTEPVDMSGMYLSDNLNNPTKWRVPDGVVIPSGGYLLFIADGDTGQGSQHISWSLSKDGESISLYEPDGETLVDRVVFGPQRTDIAMGRTVDDADSWSLFVPSTPGASNVAPIANWVLNGASFHLAPLSPGSIASLFAANISTRTEVADSLPLPAALAGVSVTMRRDGGAAIEGPLYFVSPMQINFLVPDGIEEGKYVLTIHREGASDVQGDVLIQKAAAGLFAANADGTGVGTVNVIHVDANGKQTVLPSAKLDEESGRYVAVSFSLGEEDEAVYLVLYGTGIRSATDSSKVTATIGGTSVPVTFAGAQSEFAGLDQVNVGPLPRSLMGAGEVPVVITVDGDRSNAVTVAIE